MMVSIESTNIASVNSFNNQNEFQLNNNNNSNNANMYFQINHNNQQFDFNKRKFKRNNNNNFAPRRFYNNFVSFPSFETKNNFGQNFINKPKTEEINNIGFVPASQPIIRQIETISNDSSSNNINDLNQAQKTPMCILNELARFNKIQLQYILEDETGPAHQKTFFIKLRLGNNEEYKANGSSIKKAQQAAAKIALDNTKYQMPQKRKKEKVFNLAPTVQLNALAMKFGYEVKYAITSNNKNNTSPYRSYTNFTTNEYKPFSYPKYANISLNYLRTFNPAYAVALTVGDNTFYGHGFNRQQAKHNAANQALEYLSTLTVPEKQVDTTEDSKSENDNSITTIATTISTATTHADATTTLNVISPNNVINIEAKSENNSSSLISLANIQNANNTVKEKSEISLVQEQASKRNLKVKYELIQESGPSHIRKYISRCTVGDIQTTGEGKSKKESKKYAAIKMLEELDKIKPAVGVEEKDPLKIANQIEKKKHKKRVRNVIKVIKENPDYGKGTLNPICKLIQIQQTKKGPEPVYELIEERKKFRRHEFIMQVTIGELKCQGSGNNKRKAKQNAAEAMLIQLGFQPTVPQHQQPLLPKPVLKTQSNKFQRNLNANTSLENNNIITEKKVKFIDLKDDKENNDNINKDSPSQVKTNDNNKNNNNNSNKETNRNLLNKKYKEKQQQQQKQFTQTLLNACLIANDLLTKGHSETADSIRKNKNKPVEIPSTVTAPLSVENNSHDATNSTKDDNENDGSKSNSDNKLENLNNSQTIILSNDLSYKDKLLYIAELLKFEVNFHSLSKKDGGISSYVSISILSQDEKPLTGNGKTSTESHNEAALCALKYLAERYTTKISNEKANVEQLNSQFTTTLKLQTPSTPTSNNEADNSTISTCDDKASNEATSPIVIPASLNATSSCSSIASSASSTSTVICNTKDENDS